MFERYTEKARRVIFFARYEASAFGSPVIESEYLLLGLLKESVGNLNRYLTQETSYEEMLSILSKTLPRHPRTSTSIDLPLSDECKRILGFSAEEAERLAHQHIGTEHLMLGILHEKNCLAARLLRQRGLDLQRARLLVLEAAKEGATRGGSGSAGAALRQSRTIVEFREVGSTEPLLTHHNAALVPRIGETLRIESASGENRTYMVQDVTWEFRQEAATSSLKGVVVTVTSIADANNA